MADGSVRIDIEADGSQAEKEFKNVETAAKDTAENIEDVGNSADNASGGLTKASVAAASFIGNLAVEVIREAASQLKNLASAVIENGMAFSSSMSEVQAISGATGSELQQLEQTARDYGATTVFSASEAADALKYMALAGWDVDQSMSGLPGILDLAAASGMDLAAASDMVTDYLTAFGLEASDSTRFADMLAYAQSNANTTAEALGEAYKNSAANLNAAGQDIETTTSLLSMMANQGLKGSEAGTALTAIMRDLTASMKDGAISIGDTSVQVMDAEGNYRDLTDIIRDVEGATNGMGDAEKAAALSSAFTADSIKGLNLILNAGVDEAAKFEEELRNSSGTASKMAEVMNDNLAGDLKEAQSAFEELGLKIYDKLETPLRDAMSVVTGTVIPGLETLINNLPVVGAALGGLTSAFVAFKLANLAATAAQNGMTLATYAASVAQKALNGTFLASPIFWVIAGITALVAAFIYLWNNCEGFRNFWIGLWETIKSAASAVSDWFVSAWGEVVSFLISIWEPVKEFFVNLWNSIVESLQPVVAAVGNAFSAAWSLIQTVWSAAEPFFSAIWAGIKAVFSVVIAVLGGFFKGAWEAIKAVWDVVSGYFEFVWTSIKAIFSVVASVLGGFFKLAWSAIKAVWSTVTGYFAAVWNTIAGIFSVVESVLKGDFQGAWNAIKGILDEWAAFFSGVWEDIKGVFGDAVDVGSKIVNDIKSGISSAWESLKSWFTGIWDSLFGNLTANVSVTGSGGGGVKPVKAKTGLEYVPYDDFPALLHKGERVLTAEENAAYSSLARASVGSSGATVSRSMGQSDNGFADLVRAVGTQTAGINSLSAEYRRGSTSMRPIILELDRRELGRAVVDVGATENTRVGAKLALGGA